jgi:outer membrane protein assembly factor BamB
MRRALLILAGITLVVGLAIAFWPERTVPPPQLPTLRTAWVFEAPHSGTIVARPCITADAIFLAAAHARGFHQNGTVYALDPTTGKPKWVFDRDGEMLPTASSPLVVGDRLFVGEGMHANFVCRLQCLDAATGKPKWSFQTADHIEGGPAEANGTIFFPAGNDGLYALDAETGTQRWNFRADMHIDSCPYVNGGRVFVGSGLSRRFNTLQVVCLDTHSGKPVWRTPVDLPAWGSPLVVGDRVFVGLGNGRLTQSATPPETPAGGLACFDIATGRHLWTYPANDGVFGRPTATADRVVFGSRDGNLYGVSLEGRELFRLTMGGPVVADVVMFAGRLYAVSVPGRIVCVNPENGQEYWRHELAAAGAEPFAFASPAVSGNRLYVAVEMQVGKTGIVSLYCFELPTNGNGGDP